MAHDSLASWQAANWEKQGQRVHGITAAPRVDPPEPSGAKKGPKRTEKKSGRPTDRPTGITLLPLSLSFLHREELCQAREKKSIGCEFSLGRESNSAAHTHTRARARTGFRLECTHSHVRPRVGKEAVRARSARHLPMPMPSHVRLPANPRPVSSRLATLPQAHSTRPSQSSAVQPKQASRQAGRQAGRQAHISVSKLCSRPSTHLNPPACLPTYLTQ
ncbi:hypothetical protein BS50DRAFT_101480 [Corynespora cassiicola Philippines]|uniref:Uncharacterized protein n=1 Tax=Corynespora cassiicola Philippines TaxID=1448308 RepID=A0A2T2NC53_CORCC|nr:hypothetical protein BS50DRAFT_101480 [Corynespora cassiicola Philippines]